MARILVVDDDPKIRQFLERGLEESGMLCVTAESGEKALQLARAQAFDLVLLDVTMPGLQGWDVMEALRAEGRELPVIWVTARDAVDERIKGLKMGGDDYVVKPFAFGELLARIHAVLRRRRDNMVTQVADLEIDHLHGVVTRAGKKLDLTRTELSLLKCLVDGGGDAVPRADMLQAVWGIDFDPGTNVVEVHIRRLRKKIDDPFGEPLIHTVRGAGYALHAER